MYRTLNSIIILMRMNLDHNNLISTPVISGDRVTANKKKIIDR